MARKVIKRDTNRNIAKLVTENRAPCAFCNREVDDEVTFGKLYSIGDVQCHYFCALLSCCLVQKGPEEEGLFGFMYKDIKTELERSKKHKCSYCGRGGANLGCSVSSCRKQFHLPCGRERNAVSLYYGSFKTFCHLHAPKQSVPDHIMCKAKLRMKEAKIGTAKTGDDGTESMVCVICYEAVDPFPTLNTFWPPCCGKDEWFHRSCLQRMALTAGMHYLKCPLCNDKQNFYEAVISQGYYVPDRDAAWELEQNAFAEIYERPLTCTADRCDCPLGRNHDADQGMWDIKLCLLCGSVGAHAQCMGASETTRFVCLTCTPAAPRDMEALADTIEKMILQEQAAAACAAQHGPVMPSRMSLRRTKGRLAVLNRPSSSRSRDLKTELESVHSPETLASRQELNLSTPKKPIQPTKQDSYKTADSYKSIQAKSPTNSIKSNGSLNESPYKSKESYKTDGSFLSPMKVLEQSFNEKVCMGVNSLDGEVVDMLRKKFRKPGPLSEKKKIVNDILNGLFNNINTSQKHKEQLVEWCSPTKSYAVTDENLASQSGPKRTRNKDENNTQETPKKCQSNNKNIPTTNRIEQSPNSSKNIDLDTGTGLEAKFSINNEQHNDDKDGRDNLNDVANEEIDSPHKVLDDCIDALSKSTFELPQEFVADTLSDDSNTFDTPERNGIYPLDGNKEQNKNTENLRKVTDGKCAFKFSRLDKETLNKNNVDINLESFKKGYLKEVAKGINTKEDKFKCCFNHKHDDGKSEKVLRSVIDFAVDAHFKKTADTPRKRNLSEGDLRLVYKNDAKKRKLSEKSYIDKGDEFELEKELTSEVQALQSEEFKPQVKKTKNKTLRVKILANRHKNKRVKDKVKKRGKVKKRIRLNIEKSIDVSEKENHIEEPEDNNLANTEEVQNPKQSIDTTSVHNEGSTPKRKLHESIQWMDEITQLDKKLKIDAVRNSRKTNEKTVKNKLTKKGLHNIGQKKEIKLNEDRLRNKKQPMEQLKKKKLKKERINNNQLGDNDQNMDDTINSIEKNIKNTDKQIRDTEIDKEKKINKRDRKEKLLNAKLQKRKLEKYKKNMIRSEKYEDTSDDQNIELTIDSSEIKSNKKNETKTKLSIKNNEKDISVKIKWKKKQLRLKIESKKARIKNVDTDHSKFKQYVLQYFSEKSSTPVLVKPEKEVCPLKRKYVKQEKSPDKFKQMSIQNFFKTK